MQNHPVISNKPMYQWSTTAPVRKRREVECTIKPWFVSVVQEKLHVTEIGNFSNLCLLNFHPCKYIGRWRKTWSEFFYQDSNTGNPSSTRKLLLVQYCKIPFMTVNGIERFLAFPIAKEKNKHKQRRFLLLLRTSANKYDFQSTTWFPAGTGLTMTRTRWVC